MNDKPINALPRVDLRERAFRKYEKYICRAMTRGDYTIITRTELNMSPNTFCSRFRDAIRGFRLYKYSSDLLSQFMPFDQIKCYELMNGSVLVKNTAIADKEVVLSNSLHALNDRATILTIIEQFHEKTLLEEYYIRYDSSEQKLYFKSLSQEHGGVYNFMVDDIKGNDHTFIIHP